MASLKISELAELLQVDVNPTDLLAIVDQSASETKNCTINSIAGAIGPLFPDKSIPGSKIDGELADGSVDTNELADKSVTAIKLANQSSGIYGVRPAAGEYTGQICADSNLLYMWDGSTWAEIDGPNSIITITYGGGPVELVSVNKSNGEAEITTAFVDSTDARQFVAGPSLNTGEVAYRHLHGIQSVPERRWMATADVSGRCPRSS